MLYSKGHMHSWAYWLVRKREKDKQLQRLPSGTSDSGANNGLEESQEVERKPLSPSYGSMAKS